jgi:hypothetical protein
VPIVSRSSRLVIDRDVFRLVIHLPHRVAHRSRDGRVAADLTGGQEIRRSHL